MSKEINISVETLKDMVSKMTAEQIAAFKKEVNEVNRKAIFPAAEGPLAETATKSVIDTSFFTKQYPSGVRSGEDMARQLRATGGPWLKLSPQMEKFAEILRCRGRIEKLLERGINITEYNREIMEIEQKTVTPLTTTDVGALVPTEYLATVVEFATAQSQILPKLWRIPMSALTMRVPTLVQAAGSYFGGITLYHPDEAATKTETKPAFDYLSFTAKKLVGIIALTDELIMDSSINIINYITGLFVRAFQYQIEYEVINGTGTTGQMLGILNDPNINLVPRQTVGTVKYEDLINLESALDENFTNLTFLTRRATVNTIRKQKDSVGQPVYHDGLTTFFGGAMPPQLLGYPVIKTRNCPALGSQGDLILGDLGYYIWALRQDMTIDTSRDVLFFSDETAVRFVMRMDGMPGVSIAFAALDNVPES